MDVLPPPDYPPVKPSEYPQIPTRTPLVTLDTLHASCVSGDIQKFREILDSQSSSPEGFDIGDFYAIMIAAIERDDAQVIKELLDRGLPMDPLYALEAVKVKGKDALKAFPQNGWDINQPTSELKPPVLGYAIADEEMAAWLLDHGADSNRQCVIDLTPFSFAVQSAPISVIHLILKHGGDVRKGQLLHHAIERRSDTIEVLRLLLEKGAPINSTMYENHYPSRALFQFMSLGTPLHKASELGKADVVQYLLGEGASQSIKDANGCTAMECAQMSSQWEVIEALTTGCSSSVPYSFYMFSPRFPIVFHAYKALGLRAADSLDSRIPNLGPAFLGFHFVWAYGVLSSRTLKQWYGIDHQASPREDLVKYGDAAVRDGKITRKQLNMLKRNEAAHANSVENYSLLVGSLLFASYAGVPAQTINVAGLSYTIARILYGAVYIFIDSPKWSYTRAVAWWWGNVSCFTLLYQAGKLLSV
ncbi:Ankyrin repeat protein [Penicillium canariense]|uniref:Ankyrin repeat protein n=1 Tax=Penicillium canariense TaxID=189055 RepID=A0A9W9HVT7_9EURO|nr:Ankyrin repeat protein [Penicillium canariense]KAJ5157095.1 Ankyrin repeat protein [Penicillium canariense]